MLNIFNDERARNNAIQVTVLSTVIVVCAMLVWTTYANLSAQGITSGFGFLQRTTGWDIPFSLIEYSIRDPYWRVLLIGFQNTICIGLFSLFFATLLGGLIGVARISKNPLLRFLGTVYVEIFRNVPLILQAFFWYAIATHLPPPRRAYEFGEMVFLSSRGIYVPALNVSATYVALLVLMLIICAGIILAIRSRQASSGSVRLSIRWSFAALVLLFVAGLIALVLFGRESGAELIETPVLKGLRFAGGLHLIPEFSALAFSIIVFGSAYIGEIVRGGFNAVDRGQLESARALGLRPWTVLLHIHFPLALRAIVPPIGNMYVWLMKATTLGIAIGFSDFFMIVSTSINQSGQTIELLFIMMSGFFIINYSISFLMNQLNRSIALRGYETTTKLGGAEL